MPVPLAGPGRQTYNISFGTASVSLVVVRFTRASVTVPVRACIQLCDFGSEVHPRSAHQL